MVNILAPAVTKAPTYVKVANFPCLYRHARSGRYYACKKLGSIRRESSLRTSDRKIAEQRLKEWIGNLDRVDAEVEKTTLGQLIQRFVSITGGMAHNTHVTNNAIINEFLRWWPHGKDYQVRLIRPSSLDEWLALQEPRLRNVSYNRYAGFLKQLFDIAVKDRIIAESPAKSLRVPWKKPQVPVSCVRDLIRRVKETGSAAAKARGGGAPRQADARQERLLAGLVTARSDDTLEEYRAALVAAPGGASVSGPTISRMLARLRLTQKKKTLHADERQSERVQALRAAWPERMAGVAARDLVFIDESGCHRAMMRTRARSLAGTRAFATAPRNWGDNVSIISALGLGGPLATLHLPGAVNGEVFLFYIKEVLLPRLWPGAVVVLDNLGAHRVKAVRACLEAAGVRLEYLPPYSPDLNPIELAWSKLKG